VAEDVLSYCREGTLLDIGTGPAWLLLKLHQRSPSMRLVGIDSSPEMLARARETLSGAGLGNDIELKEGNAATIPYLDEVFDIVISTASVHHWKRPTVAFNEAYRILKKGGYALIYDVISDIPKSIIEQMKHEYGGLKMFLFWIHSFEEPFYTQKNFEAIAEATLFRKEQAKFVGLMYCLVLRK
jgi:ubiquinone/menaquinone biosynthesis C-methylase UbiE